MFEEGGAEDVARTAGSEDSLLVGQRAARARAALARAEERTGATTWAHAPRRGSRVEARRPVVEVPRAEVSVAEVPVATSSAPPSPREAPEAEARLLPVTQDLTGLLPSGGLARGSTVAVCGSTSLVLALLAEASRAGAWVALVGMPTVGVLAAHQMGLVLERVALVPDPGREAATVVAALLDGMDVVVVGPTAVVAEADRRRLLARARERGNVLLPLAPWAGAQVVLTVEEGRWEGLGRGWGRLDHRQVTVRREGRGAAARSVRTEVVLPPPSLRRGGAGRSERTLAPSVTAEVLPFRPERRAG